MVKSLKSNPTRQGKKDQPKASKKQVKETKALESEDLEAVSESDESDIEGFQSASENEATSDVGSSEEEEEDDEEEGELGEIELKQGSHTIKKLDPKKQSENDKAKAKKDKSSDLSGILYISRLPQGFKERELSKYFSQFGDLKQVRLARNKKTGNSRHYAFLEYINKDDAIVAQESMNNYLLMGHLLKVKVLPNGSSIDKLFRYKKKPFVTSKVTKSSAQLKKTADEKHEERIAKLKDAGIDFKW
ncbi:Nop15 [Kluyveromyces lactis]|nr:Nop15 [Kluyveromyces lactis]